MIRDAHRKGIDLRVLDKHDYSALDNVIIHGDYCLPNIIMDNFAFNGRKEIP